MQGKVEPIRQAGGEVAGLLTPLWRAAEMKADADCLSFDKDAGLSGGKGLEGGFGLVDGGEACRRLDRAAGFRQLKSVRAGQQELAEAEIAQRRDRTAADNGKPAIQPVAQMLQKGEQIVIDHHPVGRIRYGSQGSIEIEE